MTKEAWNFRYLNGEDNEYTYIEDEKEKLEKEFESL
jgi:hypothetical protein